MLSMYGGHGNDPHFVPVAYSLLPFLSSLPACRNSGLESAWVYRVRFEIGAYTCLSSWINYYEIASQYNTYQSDVK
jgi:hypothetical protein